MKIIIFFSTSGNIINKSVPRNILAGYSLGLDPFLIEIRSTVSGLKMEKKISFGGHKKTHHVCHLPQ